MANKLKLGIIGMSEGNGHPYSWSAIFNGYNKSEMAKCPFPQIFKYLSKENYPKNFLSHLGEVSHIWTQDFKLSNQIALAANISNVCIEMEEMIGKVDAVLLARDDAENHYKNSILFLKAGLPIYIDKPFALNIFSANKLWESCVVENQIFTCSALQFAKEFQPKHDYQDKMGNIKMIWATTPNDWDKYAVHLIEPVLNLLDKRGKLEKVQPIKHGAYVEWESGVSAIFKTTGDIASPIWIKIQREYGFQDMYFQDSFYAFKMALERFVDFVNKKKSNLSITNTKEMVEILEKGKNA